MKYLVNGIPVVVRFNEDFVQVKTPKFLVVVSRRKNPRCLSWDIYEALYQVLELSRREV